MIRVFIGYDVKEPAAFTVCCHSILRHASIPVSIVPIMLSQLRQVFTRERHPLQSTDFAFSRFLVPYLSHYEGWSLFIDGDMIVTKDIADLWALRDEQYAVQVVKHDHAPKADRKFFGAPQTKYEKKNWSSVMLMNNKKCRALTPDYVNTATGLQLHQFKWLESDDLIGELPEKWNHLVGYSEGASEVALIHYTEGGPYLDEYRTTRFAKQWYLEKNAALFADNGQQAEASARGLSGVESDADHIPEDQFEGLEEESGWR